MSALNKDKHDLRGQTLGEKFKLTVEIINNYAFLGQGKIIPLHKKGFNLYEEGQNQIIQFEYGAGNLTIIWSYKFFHNEVKHEKTFRDLRNLSLHTQQEIADEMINEMAIIIANHKKKVLAAE